MQPFSNSSKFLIISCSDKIFTMIPQMVQELSYWWTNKHTRHCWTTTPPSLRYRCILSTSTYVRRQTAKQKHRQTDSERQKERERQRDLRVIGFRLIVETAIALRVHLECLGVKHHLYLYKLCHHVLNKYTRQSTHISAASISPSSSSSSYHQLQQQPDSVNCHSMCILCLKQEVKVIWQKAPHRGPIPG